jgi:hypothetical protein
MAAGETASAALFPQLLQEAEAGKLPRDVVADGLQIAVCLCL